MEPKGVAGSEGNKEMDGTALEVSYKDRIPPEFKPVANGRDGGGTSEAKKLGSRKDKEPDRRLLGPRLAHAGAAAEGG